MFAQQGMSATTHLHGSIHSAPWFCLVNLDAALMLFLKTLLCFYVFPYIFCISVEKPSLAKTACVKHRSFTFSELIKLLYEDMQIANVLMLLF